jgi:hypothetical protein
LKTRVILRLSGHPSSRRSVNELHKRLPELDGRAIRIRFLPQLSAGSRKLYSRRTYGQPVYAGTFIRKRRIVLDLELAGKRNELVRILTHELFHFAWVRLGNETRRSYEDLLRREWSQRARGELGWSAESRKLGLSHNLRPTTHRPRNWRDYACESFCDTAAWLYSGIGRHPEFTLARRYRKRRAEWFRATFHGRRIPI